MDGRGDTRREAMAGMGAATLLALAPPLRAATAPCALATPLAAVANDILAHMPDVGVRAGVPAAMDGGPLAARIDDYSPEGEAALRGTVRKANDDLAGMDCTRDPHGTLTLATARAVTENALRSADVPYGRIGPFGFTGHLPYLVNPLSGPVVEVAGTMRTRQSLSTPAAVEAWLTKLNAFPNAFAGVAETVAADAAAGCRPPRVLLERALAALHGFVAGPADRHPLIVALRDGMARAGLDAALRDRVLVRAIRSLETSARPAHLTLTERVEAMLPDARGDTEAGVWAQPQGGALYAGNVRALADTALPPDEIHRLGLSEVARITARMDRLLAARGLTRGTVGERMAALARDPAHLFPDGEAGREALLAALRDRVARMEAIYPRMLPAALIPRQPLDVRRMVPDMAIDAPGGFYDGAPPDGPRAGILWVNLRDMAAQPRFRLPTFCHHEGVPGHHTQASVAAMQGERPLLPRIAGFNACQEGWALYAEQLAAELGAYARDPLGELGRLQAELFRAARLVVDTGLHARRWDRPRAIATMQRITGLPLPHVTAEVHRCMAWPGQALGYTLGKLRLLALRDRLRARQGRRFSPRAFHGAVLEPGAMPLDLLEAHLAGGHAR